MAKLRQIAIRPREDAEDIDIGVLKRRLQRNYGSDVQLPTRWSVTDGHQPRFNDDGSWQFWTAYTPRSVAMSELQGELAKYGFEICND